MLSRLLPTAYDLQLLLIDYNLQLLFLQPIDYNLQLLLLVLEIPSISAYLENICQNCYTLEKDKNCKDRKIPMPTKQHENINKGNLLWLQLAKDQADKCVELPGLDSTIVEGVTNGNWYEELFRIVSPLCVSFLVCSWRGGSSAKYPF